MNNLEFCLSMSWDYHVPRLFEERGRLNISLPHDFFPRGHKLFVSIEISLMLIFFNGKNSEILEPGIIALRGTE